MLVSCGLSELGRIGWREKGPMLACYMAGRTRAFICWCAEHVTPKMLRIWGCTGMGEPRYTHNKAKTCIFWCEKDSQSFPTGEEVKGRFCGMQVENHERSGSVWWAYGR